MRRVSTEKLAELLSQGYSYAAIAKMFGISRQAVQALAQRRALAHLHYTPMEELVRQSQISREAILNLIQSGKIKATKAGSKWIIHSLDIPLSHQCRICGSQIPITRVYCKHHTRADIGRWRYANDADFRMKKKQAQARYFLKRKMTIDTLKPG